MTVITTFLRTWVVITQSYNSYYGFCHVHDLLVSKVLMTIKYVKRF